MSWKQTIVCSMLAAGLFGTGCGNNNEPSNIKTDTNSATNNTTPTNNTSNNTTPNNTTTSNNANNTVVIGNCEDVEDIGSMGLDDERPFRASAEVDALSCRLDVGELASNGADIIQLRYPEEMMVTFRVAALSTPQGNPPRPGLELRRSDCESGAVIFCGTDASYTEVLAANTTYFLIANGLLDSPGMDIRITARPVGGCTPGATMCADGMLSICRADGLDFETTACPTDCAGDVCTGSVCAAPIVIAPTLNGPAVVVQGTRKTFAANWDAMGGAGCEVEAGSGPATSPGPETFLLVEGVMAGQTLTLDAEISELSYSFFIVDSCTATTCLDAFAFDVMGFNRGTYVAPANGDVLVAFEANGTNTDRGFTLEVSLRE